MPALEKVFGERHVEDKAADAVKDGADYAADAVKDGADYAADAVKSAADYAADSVGNARDHLNEEPKSLWEKISDTAETVKESLFGGSDKNAGDRLAAEISNATNEAGDAIGDFRYEIKRDGEAMMDHAKEQISATASSLKENMFGEGSIGDRAASAVRNAADKTSDALSDARDRLSRDGESMMERAKETMSSAADSVKGSVFGGQSAQEKMAEAVDHTANATTDFIGDARDQVDSSRGSLAERAKDKVNDVADSVKSTVYGVKADGEKAFDSARHATNEAADAVGDATDEFKREGESMMDRAKDKMSDTAQTVKETLFGHEKSMGERLAADINNATNEAGDAISDFRYELNRDDDSMMDRAKDKMNDAADSFFDGKSAQERMAEAVDHTANAANDAIGDRADGSMGERAKDMINSTADSIKSNVYGLESGHSHAADSDDSAADRIAEIFREANENLSDARQLHDF